MGSVGAKHHTLPDEFNGRFGDRAQESSSDRLQALLDNPNSINPDFAQSVSFRKNCALCATAVALQARGYDVEAMPRDSVWRGQDAVFDVDYSNPDNYIMAGSRAYLMAGDPVPSRDGQEVLIYWANGPVRQRIAMPDNVQRMPRGATASAKAIENKVKSWGDGAVAQLSVHWKGLKSSHALNVINVKGQVIVFDAQSGKRLKLNDLMANTTAIHSTLVRLDNAPLRKDNEGALSKMFKKRR